MIRKGVDAEKIMVIPDGITLKILNIGKHPSRTHKQILTIGRIDFRNKGQDTLLYAFQSIAKTYEDLRLVIVGDGVDKEKLVEIRRRLNLTSHVAITGKLPEKEKHHFLASSDIFCLPSRTEAFGLVLLEAMLYGLPIVATDVGGIPEVVNDCAVLVPPNNPDLMARALIQVLTNDKLAQTLRQRGLRHVTRYNWDILVKKYERLYKEVIKK